MQSIDLPVAVSVQLATTLAREDFMRRSPSRLGGRAEHKEWQHFLVHGDDLHLLVNFNLNDDPWATASAPAETARVIVLVRHGGAEATWDGDVERFAEDQVRVVPGEVAARFGDCSFTLEQGRYRLRIALRERPILVDLTLTPVTEPATATNQTLSAERTMSWLLVPRLLATGTVTVGGRCHTLRGAQAYHDHNWGHFRWGGDFNWEWGSVLPSDPRADTSLVFWRMADGNRARVRCQGLYVWCGGKQRRLFRDGELSVRVAGHLRARGFLKLPRVMALLSAGDSSDVPARFEVEARADGDLLRLSFEPSDLCQLVMPDETRMRGVTLLHEVVGVTRVEGRVAGKPIEMEGRGVFEFMRPA